MNSIVAMNFCMTVDCIRNECDVVIVTEENVINAVFIVFTSGSHFDIRPDCLDC